MAEGRAKGSVEKGATVDFLWKPDAKGMGFRNIIASTVKNLGGGTLPTASMAGKPYAPAAKAYSTLGVELGHASNLAMEMCLKMDKEITPGTDEFYKAWVHHTDKIFTIMQKIRASKEGVAVPEAKVAAPEPLLKAEEKELMDSIF